MPNKIQDKRDCIVLWLFLKGGGQNPNDTKSKRSLEKTRELKYSTVMNTLAPIVLCFVPFVTMFALFAILIPGISVAKEIAASVAGLLALIPITIVQFAIPGMRLFGQSSAGGILLYSILFLGLVEECFKALSLFIAGGKGEKHSSWLCYSFLAGMIFGSFESVIYFLLAIQNIGHGVTLNLIYLRMFTAVLVHTLCAGLGGWTVYYFKNIRGNFWPLLNAVLLHGLYDYFVSFDSAMKFFSAIVILSAALQCRVYYLRAREDLQEQKKSSKKILDPNKTVELPKKTVAEKTLVVEEDVVESDAVDFDQIERQAQNELKAQKSSRAKKTAPKSSSKSKAASTSAAKTASKPKTRAASSAASKSSAKKSGAAKSSGKAKTASKPKTVAAKKTANSSSKTKTRPASGAKGKK